MNARPATDSNPDSATLTPARRTARARLGLMFAALLVPLMVLLHAPLVVAVVPSAVLTFVSIQGLERAEAERPAAIVPEFVDPNDPLERERIRRAIVVPDTSRVTA